MSASIKAGRFSPYWQTGLLPQFRADVHPSREPYPWLCLAWAEYLAGNPGRARDALAKRRRLTTNAKESPDHHFWALLLDRLLRPRPMHPRDLRRLLDHFPDTPDAGDRLAPLGQYVVLLERAGCSPVMRAGLFSRLATRAATAAPMLETEFRLREASCLLAAGRLARAREVAEDIRTRRLTTSGAPQLAAVIERVAAVCLGQRRGLEGLGLDRMNLFEVLRARLLLAACHLRTGHWERADEQLERARRRNRRLRDPGTAASIELLAARRHLLAGAPEEAAASLALLPRSPTLSQDRCWERRLLEARLEHTRGNPRGARARLSQLLPHLIEQENAWNLRDARLLELELDLARPPDDGTEERVRNLWEESLSWEEPTDRLRIATRIQNVELRGRLGTRVHQTLDREASGGCSRARALSRLLTATRLLVDGRRAEARAQLRRMERPPAMDLPEQTLSRWLELLESDRADANSRLRRSRPETLRTELRLLQRIHGRGEERVLLVGPRRRTLLDSWERTRLQRSYRRAPLYMDALRGEVYSFGVSLGMRRSQRLFEVLEILLESQGQAFTIPGLVARIWNLKNIPYETDTLVYTSMSRLRRKLPEKDWILTSKGTYRINPELDYLLLAAPSRDGIAD